MITEGVKGAVHDELPCCWPMLEEHVAYVLDLSSEEWEWMNSKGKPIHIDSVIQEHVSYCAT